MGLMNRLPIRRRTPLERVMDAVLGSRTPLVGGRATPLDRLTGRTRKPANPLVALLGGMLVTRVLGGRRRSGVAALLPGVLGAVATAVLGNGSRGRRR